MKIGYVVLYVKAADACFDFWTDKIGMVEKQRKIAGDFSIVQVGFPDQDFALELVPLDLMKDNPAGLDLATPSIAFYVDSLAELRSKLISRGIAATEPSNHSGLNSFAFPDNENRWFAVIESVSSTRG